MQLQCGGVAKNYHSYIALLGFSCSNGVRQNNQGVLPGTMGRGGEMREDNYGWNKVRSRRKVRHFNQQQNLILQLTNDDVGTQRKDLQHISSRTYQTALGKKLCSMYSKSTGMPLRIDLDNIIIGRDKIFVNLSRFQKETRGRRERWRDEGEFEDRHEDQRKRNIDPLRRTEGVDKREKSYANAVQSVIQAGMMYNIQEEFQRQGYFGIKITPLVANLTLLEEQEEGEVQALLKDARSWLEQWFKEIRPWTKKEVDNSRLVWLRVYGIPVHAWHADFFSKITNKYGTFVNEDTGTLKVLTMDVARIMIRTVELKVIDECVEMDINNETFQLRIIEDSYGPMRLMVA
ncbi:hypothetical protein TSUD_407690 [Trifolium subterraneum]|uniref:Uncharacterized protein n=1 Tax=Trifolium subterraneum TaxID=3900 RepID=A0A2Z6NZR5_TRISU|nr:hypothetical protein TSUD_407690 [Trifolium subterraneum]